MVYDIVDVTFIFYESEYSFYFDAVVMVNI
jgi:hypothetical protein